MQAQEVHEPNTKELASTGLKIVALERGGPRDTNPNFLEPQIHDELRYAARHDLMQNVSRETLTFRNTASQTALPMRCAPTSEWESAPS